MRWILEEGDNEIIAPLLGDPESTEETEERSEWHGTSVVIIHRGTGGFEVFVETQESQRVRIHRLTPEQSKQLRDVFPKPVIIERSLDLPASVKIASLFKIALEREEEEEIAKFIESSQNRNIFDTVDDFNSLEILSQDRLLFRLLAVCASLDYMSLIRITGSTQSGQKTFSVQCTEKVEQLINLSHWWGQDVDARLDLNFTQQNVSVTLTDRTGHWYGLADRSQGMRYFLGCLFQLILATKESGRSLLILSDEPDFALSAVGQRDLLRVFRKLSMPDMGMQHAQIVFSTHSCELIDPNFPSRVTILRKGLYDEGTTVVEAQHNRLFEPVRSALGQRGSSLPFIDGANLLVEGETERVFIVRMSQYFAETRKNYIDLADISIIDAGGCPGMLGIVGTAKSMPGDRAYLTVLLDNDETGRTTAEEIVNLDSYLNKSKQIITVDQFMEEGIGKDTEIEDMVSPRLYFAALNRALMVGGVAESDLPSADAFIQAVTAEPMADVAEKYVEQSTGDPTNYDKPNVMKLVFDILEETDSAEHDEFIDRLTLITDSLRDRIAANTLQKRHDEVRRAMRQRVQTFKHAHPVECTKYNASELLGHLRELGNRVSAPGVLDTAIDATTEEFGLANGLQSDLLGDHSKFVQAAYTLSQKLTITT
ncbi:MAG: hypothetical protein ED559_04170 [Phycisphaera sp.]|nr:MAG: hypothetical protein ED559_04170 [Phycisphaera sp.]